MRDTSQSELFPASSFTTSRSALGGCSAMGAPVIGALGMFASSADALGIGALGMFTGIGGALGMAGAADTVGGGGIDDVMGVVDGIVYPALEYPGIP